MLETFLFPCILKICLDVPWYGYFFILSDENLESFNLRSNVLHLIDILYIFLFCIFYILFLSFLLTIFIYWVSQIYPLMLFSYVFCFLYLPLCSIFKEISSNLSSKFNNQSIVFFKKNFYFKQYLRFIIFEFSEFFKGTFPMPLRLLTNCAECVLVISVSSVIASKPVSLHQPLPTQSHFSMQQPEGFLEIDLYLQKTDFLSHEMIITKIKSKQCTNAQSRK